MKRRIAIVLLLLVLGAMVNIAVAWGCVLWPWSGNNEWQEIDIVPSNDPVTARAPSHWAALDETGKRLQTATLTIDMRYINAASPNAAIGRISTGFPFRTTRSYLIFDPPTRYAMGGFLVGDVGTLGYTLILHGFIINTLFYALLLWLLFFARLEARRMLRRRRGLCEKCAYPIGVSPVCTECGAAIPRKVEA